MRKLLFPAVALLVIAISGCSGTKFNEVKINGLYSMELPEYLTEGYDLNSEASLQYQDVVKEVYVIVIDEPKQEFIDVFMSIDEYDSSKSACDNYAAAQMESIEANMTTVTSKSVLKKSTLAGCEARTANVAGTQEGIDDAMGFTVAFIEGKETLYMVMTWTFEKDKDKYQADMDKMINSFKEL